MCIYIYIYIYTCSLCFHGFYSHDGWFLPRQAVLYTNRSIAVHISFLRYTLKKISFLMSTQKKSHYMCKRLDHIQEKQERRAKRRST